MDAKTSVWWDIENCRPPSDVNPFDIARNIRTCLHAFNLFGPLSIQAYGDTYQLTRHVQNALNSTGIILNHIPSGRKEASDKAILINMAFWASDNPPPANVLLITGDQDFSPILHRLQMRRFNVLLARPEGINVSDSLINSANTVWYWSRLARAEVGHLTYPRKAESGNTNFSYAQNVFQTPGPIARPPQALPFRNTFAPPPGIAMNDIRPQPEMRHPSAHFGPPPGLRHPSPSPPPSPSQYVRHTAPKNQFTTGNNGVSNPLFLQWPSSPQCFSGVSESRGGTRPQWLSSEVLTGVPLAQAQQDFYKGRLVIRNAMETLRIEMMLPTESNIYNCIIYGQGNVLNFNLRAALEQGVKLGELVTRNAGSNGAEQIFVPFGLELWRYVDPNLCHEYDADIWNDLRCFLCGEDTQPFVNSANQYHASLILRRLMIGRLSDLALAQIYNVIQLAILARLWIKPHRNWSPLAITIQRGSLGGPACNAAVVEKAVDVVHQPAVPRDITEHFERTAFDVVNKVLEESNAGADSSQCERLEFELFKGLPDMLPAEEEEEHEGAVDDGAASQEEEILEAPAAKEEKTQDLKPRRKEPVSVLKELKAWLPTMLSPEGYDISLVRQDFKAARGINLDHQALGFPKLLDMMKKISDVVQIAYPRPGLCKLYPPGTVVIQEKAKEKPTSADTIEKLKAWLPTFINKRGVCDMTSICKDFEKECKMKLFPAILGYASATQLLEQFSDIVRIETLQSGELVVTPAKRIPPLAPEEVPEHATSDDNPRMIDDCKALLLQMIPKCKSGYPMSRLKEDFQQRYGYTLDHSRYGCKKLEAFLERMKDRVGVTAGPGGHKLLYLREVPLPPQESPILDEPVSGDKEVKSTATATKKQNKAEGKAQNSGGGQTGKQVTKLSSQLPVYLRYSYAETVTESRLTMRSTNPLCMVD